MSKNPWAIKVGNCKACLDMGILNAAVRNCVRHGPMCHAHYVVNCLGRSHNYPTPNDRINKSRPYRPRTAPSPA